MQQHKVAWQQQGQQCHQQNKDRSLKTAAAAASLTCWRLPRIYKSRPLQRFSPYLPKLLLRHASAVYTTYSPSPHTVTKRPLGLCFRLCGGQRRRGRAQHR